MAVLREVAMLTVKLDVTTPVSFTPILAEFPSRMALGVPDTEITGAAPVPEGVLSNEVILKTFAVKPVAENVILMFSETVFVSW